ncbi:sugar ABC transporter permease [Candidatus Amarolinea dominans]|uniref:carbohydrate ABC transporter permease n=1 Tax=Candidatus Amarolinea dominans TaxID=3140696 RepID=UPI0031357E6B|nr:sugar ABC transporter permease [Anaerolineae bacterium]
MTAAGVRLPASEPGSSGRALAATAAFLLVAFITFGAALISAPTKGIRIFPLGPYINEAINSGRWFVIAGAVLGIALGAIAAITVYRTWRNRGQRQEMLAAYVFLAPYLIITVVFTVGVLLFALYIAFHKYDIFTAPQFVGLDNFAKAFRTKDFVQSLVNVFWYALVVTIVQTVFALLMAILLNSKMRGREFFRTIFYTPSVTSSVVISMIFWWLYLKTGYLNFGLEKLMGIFGLEWTRVEWLNNPRGLFQLIAMAFGGNISSDLWYLRGPSVTWMAIMFQNIFTTIPTFMLMFLAGLQDVPPTLYEAASIDGATNRQQFFKITVPMLRPVLLLVIVLSTIGTLQIFDQVKILTSGGPLGTSLTPVYLVYREAIGTQGEIQMGYAAAMAFILAIIIFVFTFLQRRFIESGTEQY